MKKITTIICTSIAAVAVVAIPVFVNQAMESSRQAEKQRRIDERNEEIAENRRKEKEDIYLKTGVRLKGDYDMTLLRAIRRGRNNYSDAMHKLLSDNGDGGIIDQLPEEAF